MKMNILLSVCMQFLIINGIVGLSIYGPCRSNDFLCQGHSQCCSNSCGYSSNNEVNICQNFPESNKSDVKIVHISEIIEKQACSELGELCYNDSNCCSKKCLIMSYPLPRICVKKITKIQ